MTRLPAEWEEQDGVLLAWPPTTGNYGPHFDVAAARETFAQLAALITRYERVLLVANEPADLPERLAAAGADLACVRVVPLAFNDYWSRDFGPLTVRDGDTLRLLDFTFNGWGAKFTAELDNQVTRRLHAAGAFAAGVAHAPVDMVLEGGSLDSDGAGTLLTTRVCLLTETRNRGWPAARIEAALHAHFGVTRVLWLDHGAIRGDDTDSHVDMLARFAPDDTILHATCDRADDWHAGPLGRMAAELSALRTAAGRPYRLLPLPIPRPLHDADGRRLAASYANFLVINGAVLVPTYRDPAADAAALATLGAAFPGRAVHGVDVLPLIVENGSLHCVTMQLPRGVLA